MSIFAGKTLMITGGTGSFGNASFNSRAPRTVIKSTAPHPAPTKCTIANPP